MDATAPVFEQKTNARLNQEIVEEIIAYRRNKGQPITVLIDGKAAAGKSTMATALADLLAKQHQPVCIIETDWFLRDCPYRTNALQQMMTARKIYADSHLQFWNWNEFEAQLHQIQNQAYTGGHYTLTGLYDQKTGECNGSMGISVAPNSIILVHGCYLLHRKLDYDLAIMLYVNREIGRRRKMSREYEKRKEEVFPGVSVLRNTIMTWELLEEPTFFRHMIKNGAKAQIIVDTSEPEHLSVIKYEVR
jgi:uridine kinase